MDAAAARASLQLLGGFSLTVDAVPVRFSTRKAEALLAFLANSPGVFHSREKLADLLWSSSGTSQARQSLRQSVFTLRRLLPQPGAIINDGDRIALAEDAIDVDVVRLRALLDREDRNSAARASELYRGPFLEGFSTGEDDLDVWIDREREALRERVLAARTRLLDEMIASDDVDGGIQLALAVLTEDPTREPVHAALIRLYARSGRRTDALRQFNACSDILWRRLGVRPSRTTRELYESIVREEHEQREAAPHPMPARSTGTVHVLLVEDNKLNQDVIVASLKGTSYELTIVDDGAAALMELGRRRFDLALIDLELPYVSGFTLIEAIKGNAMDLPIIVLTSHQDSEHEINSLALGADDFIRKPIQREVLRMRIDRVLGKRNASTG